MTFLSTDPLTMLFGFCSHLVPGWAPGPLRSGTGIVAELLAMASLGALGSATHCAPMCGPLVLGQVAERLACIPCSRMSEASRLKSGALLRYHLGRISTYAALGAVAGAWGFGVITVLAPWRSLVLAVGACVLLAVAWRLWRPRAAALPNTTLRYLRPLLRRVRPGGLGFGLVLGLLPCGLVYTALLAACITASPVWGALGMAVFGAATMPVLVLVGISGNGRRVRAVLSRVAPAVLVFDAVVLMVAAVSGRMV